MKIKDLFNTTAGNLGFLLIAYLFSGIIVLGTGALIVFATPLLLLRGIVNIIFGGVTTKIVTGRK